MNREFNEKLHGYNNRQINEKLEAKLARGYNITNAILSTFKGHHPAKADLNASLEREVDAYMREAGLASMGRADCIAIPDAIIRRALDTSHGDGLVPKNTGHHIPAIYAGGALERAGAGFVGLNFGERMPVFPDLSAKWIETEGGNAANSSGYLSTRDAEPKTVAAFATISHNLMTQSPEGVAGLMSEIVRACRHALEKAVFSGTGTNGQPFGLDNLENAQALAFTQGAPTRTQALDAWEKIAAKTDDADALRWIMPTDSARVFKGQLDAGDNRYLLTGGNLVDVPVITSDVATSGRAYLADWRKLRVCTFGAVDLRIVKYNAISGTYIIACFFDVDFVFTHPAAFGVCQVKAPAPANEEA